MQVNAYEYDSDDCLRCMARHIDVESMFDAGDPDLERVKRDLQRKGVADIGGGASPHFIVLRIING